MDNLSADMIQCKKDGFGCHYGAWKALQKAKPVAPVKEEKKSDRFCEYCGKEIPVNAHRRQRFCNPNCGALAHYYANRESRLVYMKKQRDKRREAKKCNAQSAQTP